MIRLKSCSSYLQFGTLSFSAAGLHSIVVLERILAQFDKMMLSKLCCRRFRAGIKNLSHGGKSQHEMDARRAWELQHWKTTNSSSTGCAMAMKAHLIRSWTAINQRWCVLRSCTCATMNLPRMLFRRLGSAF